jgi:hypothetical protein
LQGAEEGIENAVYKKLIAPFKNDMPSSITEGFKAACTRHKYAFMVSLFISQQSKRAILCQLVTLPGTSYPDPLTFVISKNSPYKRLINWK